MTSTTALITTVITGSSVNYKWNSQTLLPLEPCTSSGVYFQVGDASQYLVFIANASSSATGAIILQPGSSKWAGSYGIATSTESTSAFSTATAPFPVISVAALASSDSSAAIAASTGNFAVMGPFEGSKVKSTDNYIFLSATTLSTKMYVSVFKLPGGLSS